MLYLHSERMQNEVKSQIFITMQTTMTVRTDVQLKTEFTNLCEEFGMSANTAMNIFMRAVAETKSIPFTIGRKRNMRERFGDVLQTIHKEAIHRNEPEMSLEEINAEIAAARAERKVTNERANV